jgi:hypothetical protein
MGMEEIAIIAQDWQKSPGLSSGAVSFLAGDEAGTLVILNPLQRVKNPHAAIVTARTLGILRASRSE